MLFAQSRCQRIGASNMDDNNLMMISRSDSSTATPLLSGVSTSRNNGNESAITTKLPDSILQFIGGYLPNCSRAMMSFALFRPACFTSDTLDFGETDDDFASKLTDDDIAGILLSIDAKDTLKVLKLIGCDNISGNGLEPLRGSSVLEQIDLSTSDEASGIATGAELFAPNFPWHFALSEDIIVPILDSIISKHDKSLKHVKFPLFWRKNKSDMLTAFMERYHVAQNSRTCFCTKCKEGFRSSLGSTWMNHDIRMSKDWGLQHYTCYDCLRHVCHQCEIPFCKTCENMFCGDCCSMELCGYCNRYACNKCHEFNKCDECGHTFCSTCVDTNLCECCNRTKCEYCDCHLICEGDCGLNNCSECAHADNVQYCEFCGSHCNDCRLDAYKEGNLECQNCRGFLLPQIMQEKDSLREQLDVIKNGTSIHLLEANIEFVMERAYCSREDAIKALKEVSGSYARLDDAVALLTLKPKSNDKCIFGTDQDQKNNMFDSEEGDWNWNAHESYLNAKMKEVEERQKKKRDEWNNLFKSEEYNYLKAEEKEIEERVEREEEERYQLITGQLSKASNKGVTTEEHDTTQHDQEQRRGLIGKVSNKVFNKVKNDFSLESFQLGVVFTVIIFYLYTVLLQ